MLPNLLYTNNFPFFPLVKM